MSRVETDHCARLNLLTGAALGTSFDSMRTVLNVVWLVLSGLWMFLAYMIIGALWCVTIVGIPFGIACFRIGQFALWPFGRELVRRNTAGAGSAVGNLLWFVFGGMWLAIGHALTGVLLCLTIIGIPLGLANFKLIPVSLFPLGREIVRSSRMVG